MTVAAFVVTRPYPKSNVGSNLASMAGAVWVARRLGRTLVVDWRGMSQLGDPSLNYFSEFFESPAEVEGVPVLYAPGDEVPPYDTEGPGVRVLEAGDARRATTGEKPADEPVLVLQQYHGPDRVLAGSEAERFRFLRTFYRVVQPRPEIGAPADDWWRKHCDGAFVVGVNVRTGNGHYFGKDGTYPGRVDVSLFDDRRAFLRTLERAVRARVRRLPRPLRDDFVVFYATDSQPMSELLAALPHAVTRRRMFPPPGSGDTFRFESGSYTDRDSIVDTLVDMFLLGRCDALVYNSSMFNQYARVLTGHFGGNEVHFETLYLRRRASQLSGLVRKRLS